MTKVNPTSESELLDRLDKLNALSSQLVTLMAIQAVNHLEKVNEKILLLGSIGLDRNQIALACKTTPHTVSVVISAAKKKGRSPQKKGKKK